MRDSMQIELGVRDYLDAKQVERERALSDVLRALARSHNTDWWKWCDAASRGEHAHDLRRADGSPAACPVRGCTELHHTESDQQRVA